MYIITDVYGNINGWTRSVHKNLNLELFKKMKLSIKNINLICPHLIDFIFPKQGELSLSIG